MTTTNRQRDGVRPSGAAQASGDVTRHSVTLPPDELDALRARLRRIQGQVGAVVTMLDEQRECREVVHVLAAASGALNRAGFVLLNRAMRQCTADPDASPNDLAALEKLFLELT